MSSATVVVLALQVSLALVVFGLGLRASPRDATFLLQHRGLFARSVLAMNVIMPLLALWMAVALSLKPAVQAALVVLAVSPMPPFLPLKTAKAGGEASYAISLLAAESLLTIGLVPLTIWGFGALFGKALHVSPSEIARVVGAGILLPLAAGVGVRHYRPHVAERVAKPVQKGALVVLVAGLVPLLVTVWGPMMSLIGNGTVVAIAVLELVGLGIGHALGGPTLEHRPVLALSTATRHPAVAIAVLTSTIPGQKLARAAVLLALCIASLTALPYTSWIKRRIAGRSEARPLSAPHGERPSPRMRSAPRQHPTARVPARRRSDRRP
jgi:BASS family bile acid:Na+ symporter